MEFQKGEFVKLKNGLTIKIEKMLGKGGQGAVYEASKNGKKYALKWYLPEYLKQIDQKKFYSNLEKNIEAGTPSDMFLWPLEVSEYAKDSFGYLMELRPKNYSSFTSILNAQSKFDNVSTQIKAAKNICEAFRCLHSNGYSYQDLNDGNFFVDMKTGDVLVCDNDNVAPYGDWMGMAGKDRYMAPEVVIGKKHAGMESDLFSLAVVLYMLFFISHPLEGRSVHACPCLTTQFIRKFYAESPVFVMDPNNDTNRPVKGIDNNILTLWPLYPQSIKDLFTRSFTNGLHDAGYRVRENEWIECFNKLLDSIVKCPICGGEQFYEIKHDGRQTFICEDCNSEIRKPYILETQHISKVLYLGNQVSLNGKTIGKVVESKKHPGLWGIQNDTEDAWQAELPNGKELTVVKGKSVPLFKATKFNIGNQMMTVNF